MVMFLYVSIFFCFFLFLRVAEAAVESKKRLVHDLDDPFKTRPYTMLVPRILTPHPFSQIYEPSHGSILPP